MGLLQLVILYNPLINVGVSPPINPDGFLAIHSFITINQTPWIHNHNQSFIMLNNHQTHQSNHVNITCIPTCISATWLFAMHCHGLFTVFAGCVDLQVAWHVNASLLPCTSQLTALKGSTSKASSLASSSRVTSAQRSAQLQTWQVSWVMGIHITVGREVAIREIKTIIDMIEGSLEVKLPTIWTKVGRVREEKRRRKKIKKEKVSEERRSRCAKR